MDSCGEGGGCVYYIVDLQQCTKLQYFITFRCVTIYFLYLPQMGIGQACLVRIVRLQTDNLQCRWEAYCTRVFWPRAKYSCKKNFHQPWIRRGGRVRIADGWPQAWLPQLAQMNPIGKEGGPPRHPSLTLRWSTKFSQNIDYNPELDFWSERVLTNHWSSVGKRYVFVISSRCKVGRQRGRGRDDFIFGLEVSWKGWPRAHFKQPGLPLPSKNVNH
jgi:hypothetical protein